MKKRTIQIGSTLRRAHRRYNGALIALTVGLGVLSSTAIASTSVSGTADFVTVDAQNTSIKEILSALGQKFRLQVDSSANLDKTISGSYHGSLGRVVVRLLEGYNFILRTNQDELQVTVLGTETRQNITGIPGQGSPITAAPPPAATVSKNAGSAIAVAAATPIPATTQAIPAASKAGPTTSSSSLSQFEFKIADGAGPVPTPGKATTSGPIPQPATSQMPQPKPSTGGPNVLPSPTPTHDVVLPMPTGGAPFPGMSGSTGQSSAPPPNSKPANSAAAAPSAPAQSTPK